MKALLYKQLRLTCHPMTLVFLMAGVFLLIPNYPYSVSFFYVTLGIFFMFMNGREQRDADYCAVLPIRKWDGVRAACVFSVLVQLTSLVLAMPFAVLSARINPNGNLAGLDANAALFALGFILFAVFNAIFLPSLYRSGYRVGTSFLKATAATAAMVIGDVIAPHLPRLAWMDGTSRVDVIRQLPLLAMCAAIYGLITLWSCQRAEKNYERVDL